MAWNVQKMGNGKSIEDMQQVAGALFPQLKVILCSLSKACPSQDGVDPAVCMPGGCSTAFVSRNILTFGFLKDSV